MTGKRVYVLVGHYGSGKTSVAVSIARGLAAHGKETVLADMDIVNPYFRAADRRKALEEAGVRLIVSAYAGTNLDTPSLPKALYGAVSDRSAHAVLDVGGDDRGAVALGRFSDILRAEGDYEGVFVANFFRPLTRTPEEAAEALRQIERASGLPCTGIINNSNLAVDTTAEDVRSTVEKAERLSKLVGLPILSTGAAGDVYRQLEKEGAIDPLLEISL